MVTPTGDSESPRLLITVEAAAELLSISRTRMYALIKAGEVMSVRVGRLRRIPVGALDAFMTRLLTDQNAA
jgi:excisionase family DNA binding protein